MPNQINATFSSGLNFERTNIVQSLKFSEMMNNALSNYLKGLLTNEEVIAELLRMAEEIRKCEEEGNELGLTVEEKAFYDALSSPEGVKDAYTNEEFIKLTKELTEQLRKNRTIDWNHKDSARAKMRVMIKRLLKKYHYPPEGQEQALRTVMAQCNKWADEDDNFIERKIMSVVADRDISNLINNRLQINPETSDASLQKEVLEVYGERYPDMSLNDWRHIIEDYTPSVRETIQRKAKEVEMNVGYPIAADPLNPPQIDPIKIAKSQAVKLAEEHDGKTVIQHITIENHFENSIDTVHIHGEPKKE